MNNKLKTAILIPTLILPSLLSCNKTSSVDFSLLKNNFKKMLKETIDVSTYKNKTASQIKEGLNKEEIGGVETYYFKDIDYTDDKRRTEYPARKHLDRALQIAIIADNDNNEDLKEIVRKLEYHWVFKNYKSANWYENEIGTIRSLTNIGVFQYDDLNEKGKEAFKGKVRNGSIYYHPGLELHQGANLIDYAQNTFKSGIIDKNEKETDCGYNRLLEEIKENDKEGFQDEGSYFQHGRLLSTGSYGNVATSKLADFVSTFKGSKYILPKDKLKIILNCVLLGLRYMTHREYKNYMCEGRGFCLKDPFKYSIGSLKKYLDIDGIDDESKNQLQTFFDNHDNGKSAFNDIRVFPKARVIASNINDVYIAFKGTDPITVNSECLNNENELAYNLSYGMNTSIMQSGLEYENLSPVCDFSFMPGATSQDYGFEDIETNTNSNEMKFYKSGDKLIFDKIQSLENERFEDKVDATKDDGTPYVYGMADELTDNNVACCFQQGRHSKKKDFKGQTFTVSCFSTNKGMVILGAGMKDLDEPSKSRYVTLQQCRVNKSNDLINRVDDKTIKHNYKNDAKKINTNVFYKSLNNENLTLRENNVKGNFKRNHSTYSAKESEIYLDTMITYMPIDNENKYAYSIQTDNNEHFKIAINNEDIQAIVLPDGKIAASFFNKDKTKQTFKYNSKQYTLSKEFSEDKGAFEVFN